MVAVLPEVLADDVGGQAPGKHLSDRSSIAPIHVVVMVVRLGVVWVVVGYGPAGGHLVGREVVDVLPDDDGVAGATDVVLVLDAATGLVE
ncbi:hypothetical protein Namu_3612 [Nakamurella multipartita DSM 44233]|uniref:Uncharacterized protein n=1 Tax=Nakamurella multipartita (strain ATCC 700099 / DSM 44233 / CIP 104796 / JCM 9543 / NBRC 105858 / Y-104) TaxID=479431 RepID=C8XFF2_NAKMY|nr:hypothetical protein Namu_3612 [Nakamurella multipartita DSM 44233]